MTGTPKDWEVLSNAPSEEPEYDIVSDTPSDVEEVGVLWNIFKNCFAPLNWTLVWSQRRFAFQLEMSTQKK